MKYHTISTSKSGHGAIFTNLKEAGEYQANHSKSVYHVFDKLPLKIPSIGKAMTDSEKTAGIPVDSFGEIIVYTDGSALNNPGPGGFGAIIQMNNATYEFSQGYEYTTNNRMEMMAVITALKNLKDNTDAAIIIHSDSQYTINGITKGWAKGWRKRNWKKGDGKPALNPDLWGIMLDLVEQFPKLAFKWVKGHAGNVFNERADVLANSAAQGNQGADMMVDRGYKK